MSYHYPHHVGRIVPAQRPNSDRVAELVRRYPGVTQDEAKEIRTFLNSGRLLDIGLLCSDDGLRPKVESFIEHHKMPSRSNWREHAPVAGGILVLAATSWLIWAALAEVVIAAAATG